MTERENGGSGKRYGRAFEEYLDVMRGMEHAA